MIPKLSNRIPRPPRIQPKVSISCWLMLLLPLTFVGKSLGADATNAAPKWLTLVQVRQKWDAQPLDAVKQAAEGGDLTAQHYLGYSYASGTRVPLDGTNAVKWYERAGARGHLPSYFNIANLYLNSKVVPQDVAAGVRYLRLAAEGGFPMAMVLLGRVYYAGEGIPKNPGEAMKWFQKAGDLGESQGEYFAGYILDQDEGHPEAALGHYLKAATLDSPDAMFALFLLYIKGRGVAADPVEGERWLIRAAEAGYTVAQGELGWHNENPRLHSNATVGGQPASIIAAVKWYRASAEKGFAFAQYRLGLCYMEAKGVETDEEVGLDWVRKASDGGYARAAMALARYYDRGIGEPRSRDDEPMHLYHRVLEMNVKDDFMVKGLACDEIRFRHEHGIGTPEDLVAASEWYSRAVLAGDLQSNFDGKLPGSRPSGQAVGEAMTGMDVGHRYLMISGIPGSAPCERMRRVLGEYLSAAYPQDATNALRIAERFTSGADVPKDAVRAWVWFNLAASRHSSEAVAKRDEIGKALTPAELTDARKQAKELAALLEQVRQALPSQPGR
jgi:TPR repeat protein